MDIRDQIKTQTFEISFKDAKRIIDGLELNASWDKTEIYYELVKFVKEIEKS